MAIGMSDIAERVTESLANYPQTAQHAIEVIDEDGLVTLRGVVASEEDRTTAEEIASAQGGVMDVVNELKVREEPEEEPPAKTPGGPPAHMPGASGTRVT
jgi:osmotically-inducible protein OsmY